MEGRLVPAMSAAAAADNAEGIRLLCEAGGNPLARNFVGLTNLMSAASAHAPAALEELVALVAQWYPFLSFFGSRVPLSSDQLP